MSICTIARVLSALFTVASLLPCALGASQGTEKNASEGTEIFMRVYPIRFLGIDEARYLIEQQFTREAQRTGWGARLRNMQGSTTSGSPHFYYEVFADEETHRKVEAILKEKDGPPRTHIFQILLLKASKAEGAPPELTGSASKALQEARSFLPYKSFRLLDSGLLNTSEAGQTGLVGYPESGYMASLRFRSGSGDDQRLYVEDFGLTRSIPSKEETRRVLSTSFSINVGETIVLGTSKLDSGDEALVVLLTAVK